jgi:Ca2+-binding RTX toxin-like protein
MEETIIGRSRTRRSALALIGAFAVLLAAFVVWAGPASAQVSPVLFGADGAEFSEEPSDLYTINPSTGERTSTIGSIGFEVTGLAVDPTTGQLYGATANGDPSAPGALIKIDKTTGEGTFIGFHFLLDPSCSADQSASPDITFTTDGQLWGWTKNCADDDQLMRINKATGRGTAFGTGFPGSFGNGLAADPDDNTMWLAPDGGDGDYGTLDKTTGAYTSQGTLDGTGDFGDNISALAWSCDGETLHASIRDGFFATINTAADDLIPVGRGDPQQDAIAFDCAPPAPVAQCKGLAATLVGTSGSDVLTGTAARDVIAALGGNDRIAGLGGNDVICAGAGKDRANGGGGKDRLLGQGGNDRLRGAAGRDNLRGGGGFDRCNGGAGRDKGRCEIERNIP